MLRELEDWTQLLSILIIIIIITIIIIIIIIIIFIKTRLQDTIGKIIKYR